MARPIKDGFDYFPFDVSFFSDRKIKILKARFGADGIAVYIYLLCEIYKSGFFAKYDKDFEYIIADDLNMSADKIKQIISFLCERSLLDGTLLASDTVMTSCGIQRRYLEMSKKRTAKVDPRADKYWLLGQPVAEDSSTQNGFCSENDGFFSENGDFFGKKYTKESKEKVKKSESKEREDAHERLLGRFENVRMTNAELLQLEQLYGKDTANGLIDDFSCKLKAKGYRYESHFATILSWARNDGVKPQSGDTFDTESFFREALRRSYGNDVDVMDQKCGGE